MKCPHCGISFNIEGVDAYYHPLRFASQHPYRSHRDGLPDEKNYSLAAHRCPECVRPVVWLFEINTETGQAAEDWEAPPPLLLMPKWEDPQVPDGVPEELAEDYREACRVLELSPKASAALARRCLQALIRQQEGIRESTLCAEVSRLLDKHILPEYLTRDLDAIRVIGNFAAHPTKDTQTDSIVDVEPDEASWTLGVLRALLQFYFVDEPRSRERREALSKKLKSSGRGELRAPSP